MLMMQEIRINEWMMGWMVGEEGWGEGRRRRRGMWGMRSEEGWFWTREGWGREEEGGKIWMREMVISAQNKIYNYRKKIFLSKLKGTVSIISSDLPFIEWHVRFTTIPFKPYFVDILIYKAGNWKLKCQLKPRKCTPARSVQCYMYNVHYTCTVNRRRY